MERMNIGEAAAAAGVTPKMIRHYESLGLIPQVERTEAGYRLYTRREVEMLRFVRQARALGFSIQQIDALLKLWRDERRESRAVKALALEQLAQLEERQRELDAMRATLSGLVADCAGDHEAGCAILERLSAPAVVPAPRRRGAAATLKQVRPGSSAQRPRGKRAAQEGAQGAQPPHAALQAWSRTFAAAA